MCFRSYSTTQHLKNKKIYPKFRISILIFIRKKYFYIKINKLKNRHDFCYNKNKPLLV